MEEAVSASEQVRIRAEWDAKLGVIGEEFAENYPEYADAIVRAKGMIAEDIDRATKALKVWRDQYDQDLPSVLAFYSSETGRGIIAEKIIGHRLLQ